MVPHRKSKTEFCILERVPYCSLSTFGKRFVDNPLIVILLGDLKLGVSLGSTITTQFLEVYPMFRLLILYPILSFGGCQVQEQVHPLPGKVQTTSGWIQGAPGPEGTTIYSDIPFAQPPVGFLRWTAPQPILQPNAELKAQDRPILCPQRKGVVSGTSGAGFVGDEDCLYLDIYSPNDARKGKKLPVMFWIHGGE